MHIAPHYCYLSNNNDYWVGMMKCGVLFDECLWVFSFYWICMDGVEVDPCLHYMATYWSCTGDYNNNNFYTHIFIRVHTLLLQYTHSHSNIAFIAFNITPFSVTRYWNNISHTLNCHLKLRFASEARTREWGETKNKKAALWITEKRKTI